MFNKLIGNNRIKETLKRLIKSGRVPHSLIFAGAEGVGKRLFALELAKAAVCQNPQNGEACGVCAACRRAASFEFPKSDDRDAHKKVIFSEHGDVGMIVPYNRNILVDAIRNLEAEANFRPFEAQARFFIINDADKMNDEAANALLKTLEEPPATSHIFLVASRPDALLPTIRSRCQTLRFAPVEAAEVEKFLLETKQFSPADAELIAKLSRGKLGNTLNMNLEAFRAQRDLMLRALESLTAKKDRAALLQTAEEMNDAKNKDDYETYLEILQTLIRDAWTLRLGSADAVVNTDLKNALQKIADSADSRRLAAWLLEIETLRENLAVNLNRKIATDALFMQMAS